jgi:anti-anti-sigma factor
MDAQPFALSVVQLDDVVMLTLTGDLDLATAPELARAAEELPAGCEVTVDLRGLTFLDSTGLSQLLHLAKRYDVITSFVPGPSNVQRVFEITETTGICDWATPTGAGPRLGVESDRGSIRQREAR